MQLDELARTPGDAIDYQTLRFDYAHSPDQGAPTPCWTWPGSTRSRAPWSTAAGCRRPPRCTARPEHARWRCLRRRDGARRAGGRRAGHAARRPHGLAAAQLGAGFTVLVAAPAAGPLAHIDGHGLDVKVLTVDAERGDLVDTQGLLAQRYDLRPGGVVLLRPDQHVCALAPRRRRHGRPRHPPRARHRLRTPA